MNWVVPFFDLQLGDEEAAALTAVLASNWLTSGPVIKDFETRFGQAMGADVHCIAVSSATAALHLSLIALGIQPGDEVLLPAQTFVACANVIKLVGAKPVFLDITSETDWNLCCVDLENKITNKTKAIMPVHFAGYACDMSTLVAVAKRNNLSIIEDCSHALFSMFKDQCLGTIGDTGCFSFFSNKNMTTGEGGMIVTRNPELAEQLRILRSHGVSSSTYQRFKGHVFGYDVEQVGFNYRLDELRASLGITQLDRIDLNNAKRKEKVSYYTQKIHEHAPSVIIPFRDHDYIPSYHIFPILLPKDSLCRDLVIQKMQSAGVQCSIHYRPINTFTAYQSSYAQTPKLDKIADRMLTLPLFPHISLSQIDFVVKQLSLAINESGK